jgi:hypothetical protein
MRVRVSRSLVVSANLVAGLRCAASVRDEPRDDRGEDSPIPRPGAGGLGTCVAKELNGRTPRVRVAGRLVVSYASVVAAGAWAKLVLNCCGAAVLVTAAQLGVGQGLGIVDWKTGAAVGENGWSRLQTWVAFIFAAGVLGAVALRRRSIRDRRASTAAGVTGAVAAGLGAVAALPLVWLPANTVASSVDIHPERTITVAAGVGSQSA